MAKFIFEEIKLGFECKNLTTKLSISNIDFEESDEIVYIPSEYNKNFF